MTILTPTNDELIILHDDLTQNIAITWNMSPKVAVDIKYTVDTTDYVIATNYTPSEASSPFSYTWTPDNAAKEYLTGSNSDAPYPSQDVTITINENGDAGNAGTMDVICQRTTFTAIHPDNTDAPESAYPYLRKDVINITWLEDDLITNVVDTSLVTVYVKKDGGSWIAIAEDYSRTIGHLAWNPYTNNDTLSIVTGLTAPTKFWVKVESQDQLGNFIESYFYITNEEPGTGSSTPFYYKWWLMLSSRIDFMRRTAGEKAIMVDEHPVLAQFEAGHGIKISQRDSTGKKKSDNTDDKGLTKAYNIVIESDDAEIITIPQPRCIEGYINFVKDGTPVAPALNPDWYYGELRYYTINHGWHLGTSPQTEWSFHLEINEIIDDPTDGGTPNILSMPILGSNLYWEVLDDDNIKVYCMVKGDDTLATLAKDQFAVDGVYHGLNSNALTNYENDNWISKYVYYFRLEEKLPH